MFARGDERDGTGYSLPFGLKNLQTSLWSARIFKPRGEHPLLSVTRGVHRANKLQTAIIRIKKISPYDTE